jgi:energy-coupling factor transport system permease protein
MATPSRLTTRVLLICAAIGVGTGLLQALAGGVSLGVSSVAPLVYGLVLGVHVLPGVVAQDLLRMPFVAIITHFIAALIASAFGPQWTFRYLGTALLIGGLQEGIAAISRYRRWEPWRFFVSAAVVGVVLAVAIGVTADVDKFVPWARVIYVALFFLGPLVWTAVGLAIVRGLRRAGVARIRNR